MKDVVNLTLLKSFLGDDPAIHKMFLDKFAGKADGIKAELDEAQAGQDWKTIAAVAHKFKSSSMSVGAENLSALFLQMEAAASAQNQADYLKCKQAVYEELDRFSTFVSQLEN